jgi:transcriptional regulator GlxA family with amidase domain
MWRKVIFRYVRAMSFRPHLVAVLALDRVIPLDFAIPVQVFGGSPYQVQVCAPRRVVRTTADFGITASAGLPALRQADTVVVPGFVPHAAPVAPAVLDALRRAHARGARMVSICTGAFVLAQAGLLEGRPATTHWRHAAELARNFPAVRVHPDVLYVDDGDVLTSAGVSAGIDLCLHIVRTDSGVAAARRVAQAIVAAPHREGNQAQYVQRPVGAGPGGPFAALCGWITGHLDADISLAELARRSAMSSRTFSRRFREATGSAPMQWVLAARVDEARRLLEGEELSVEEIALRCGFGTALNLRVHFRQRLETTPTAYRRAFHDQPRVRPGTTVVDTACAATWAGQK